MRVLGNDAVQDPTKVEAMVRAQMVSEWVGTSELVVLCLL